MTTMSAGLRLAVGLLAAAAQHCAAQPGGACQGGPAIANDGSTEDERWEAMLRSQGYDAAGQHSAGAAVSSQPAAEWEGALHAEFIDPSQVRQRTPFQQLMDEPGRALEAFLVVGISVLALALYIVAARGSRRHENPPRGTSTRGTPPPPPVSGGGVNGRVPKGAE